MWVSTFLCANELVETKWNESKINLFQSLNFSQWSTGFGKSKKHLSFSMIIPNLYVSVSEVFLCHSHNSLTTFTQFVLLFCSFSVWLCMSVCDHEKSANTKILIRFYLVGSPNQYRSAPNIMFNIYIIFWAIVHFARIVIVCLFVSVCNYNLCFSFHNFSVRTVLFFVFVSSKICLFLFLKKIFSLFSLPFLGVFLFFFWFVFGKWKKHNLIKIIWFTRLNNRFRLYPWVHRRIGKLIVGHRLWPRFHVDSSIAGLGPLFRSSCLVYFCAYPINAIRLLSQPI